MDIEHDLREAAEQFHEGSGYEVLLRVAADEIERLRVYEVIAKSYRELPEQYHQGMLELLVKASFEAAEISHGRAAELLKCSIIDIREKGWVQGRKDEEIERLRDERDECRRLLREAVNRLESDPVWWVHSLECEYWCEQAAKVAGGEDAEAD